MQSILLKCFNFGSAITNLNLLLGFTQARGQVYNVCNLKLFCYYTFSTFISCHDTFLLQRRSLLFPFPFLL